MQSLAQTGQAVPGLLGPREHRGVRLQVGLEHRLARLGRCQGGLDLRTSLAQQGLVGDVGLELGALRDEVVCEQPQPGVAHVGLDHGGPPGHLGLLAERLELAAQLGGEVLQPGEVGLHRLELAQRLLLAFAVLEDSCGLLDEAASVLRGRVQDGVELALPHDHVHLAADATVAEQLLHVEQPAGRAVDRVLGAPVAEHDPRDRDLGVVDRQGAVGVVNGEQHLGPSERCAAGRAGEDDVFHLAAAKALGTLLAHHPREGVYDVGLARPVRPDDAGHAGLELQRRRRGERLEPPQGQALEVHASLLATAAARPVLGPAGKVPPPYPSTSGRPGRQPPRGRRVRRARGWRRRGAAPRRALGRRGRPPRA